MKIENVPFPKSSSDFPASLRADLLRQPFTSTDAVWNIAKALKSAPRYITISDTSNVITSIIYFEKTTCVGTLAFSRGRFGHLGLIAHQKIDQPTYQSILSALSSHMKERSIDLMSLVLNPLSIRLIDWTSSNQADYESLSNVFICDLTNKFDDHDNIIFSQRAPKRNLKKAKQSNLIAWKDSSISELYDWYEKCHLTRIRELKGAIWDWETLSQLCKNVNWVLYSVGDVSGNRHGGCLAFQGSDSLELFMMSTQLEFLQMGANYILTDYIYKDAKNSGIQFVNWQSSNPPTGGGADFKKFWRAEEYTIPTLSFLFHKDIRRKFSEERTNRDFKEIFVLPYDILS